MHTRELRPAGRLQGIRLHGGAISIVLGIAAACAPGGEPRGPDEAPQIEGGTILAALELEAGTQQQFVLHGTIPVPPNTFPREDGLLPLSLRGPNGFVVPTQVSVVSRYADDAAGADVVEVSGKVGLPEGAAPGKKITYTVVWDPHQPSAVPLNGQVAALLASAGAVKLRATDVFGHVYERDLFDDLRGEDGAPLADVVARSVACARVRSYGVMKPVGASLGAPDGALPHFLGVHAYVTAWATTPGFNLDLRIHNGFDGFDGLESDDDPLGTVYFRSLELVVPQEWVSMLDIVDVASAPAYAQGSNVVLPLVAPLADGKLHVIGNLAQFQRRLGISLAGSPQVALHLAAAEGQAFALAGKSPDGPQLWSWWNPDTARYWPQKQPLPSLSHIDPAALTSKFDGQYWMVRTALETGNAGDFQVPAGAMGWAHPWGVSYGGMTGGVEIHIYDGIEMASARTNRGWKFHQTVQRMLNDRQPTAIYDRFGLPTELEKWVKNGQSFDYIDFNFWQTLKGGNDPFGFNSAPQFQVNQVQSQGLQPSYQGALFNYGPIDFQHYIRYTRIPKVVAWLGNDWMAKDDLLQVAENFRLSHHEYPNSSGNAASGSGLFKHEQFVQQNPNHGLGFGREAAWGLDAMLCAYGMGTTDYRNKTHYWFERVADTVANGQASCSGFIQAQVVNGWLDGQWRTRSSPEHAMIENALWSLKESVFDGVDNARFAQTEAVLTDAIYAMIGPMSWAPQYNGPYFAIAVTDKDLSIPPYCGSVPPGGAGMGPDHYQGWSSLAYGYQLTGDTEFLNKASLMGNGGDLLTWLLSTGTSNVANKSALLALMQNL
ncbi:MAG TPA: hypothetical protein VMT18_13775 [Planctomycetota bacterium]|nr:hypothetical protein [Planctomycetota bacterium]